MTKADYRKLITQIAKATADREYGLHFASLLSAMRGPDDGNPNIKAHTTVRIRGQLRWRCGAIAQPPSNVNGWNQLVDTARVSSSHHFASHIESAVKALRTFRIIK